MWNRFVQIEMVALKMDKLITWGIYDILYKVLMEGKRKMKDYIEQIAEVKKIELDILKEFIRICHELNLTYYAAYGTVLGAIRHRGFIPWDDDIDVAMPREDYDFFLEKAQFLIKDNYFVQTYKTDKEYSQPFAKMRRSDTTFIEKASKYMDINHGIYIDIFPLDGYPKSKKDRFIFKWKRITYDHYIYNSGDLKKEVGKNKWICLISHCMKKINAVEAAERKDRLSKRFPYKDSNIVGCLLQDSPSKEVMGKDKFGKGTKVQFEDIEIRVPEKFDEYLKAIYGDYMKLPPEE